MSEILKKWIMGLTIVSLILFWFPFLFGSESVIAGLFIIISLFMPIAGIVVSIIGVVKMKLKTIAIICLCINIFNLVIMWSIMLVGFLVIMAGVY